ncbi:hypothetical protein A3A49_02955 [Candidatus Curtissbacteria bacterium RIFCSPLOWO2_01_FULL_38_11b]|uniref:Glycosyltransferase RgtA/B/C/D-like domain-containing protein n=1 Tax=Candidatus Curtissbacteria bacterium RIFCSPLOWO2_01_FULL_38_11b TaxID=1797725 RepID=A0A1F5H024_9BACT|nr:MAG: hypothetical protein A3A49_02955 [Candidatus Curtissbacteria bacterium RIFCSPLOWO2_01_FULL_38_11b]
MHFFKFRPNLFVILSFLIFGFFFWHLAKEMLIVRSDGLYVGQVNLYGDLVLHLTLINKFLESGKIFPDSPIFASSKINYPIFADFITAQVARLTGINFALFIITSLAGLLVIFAIRLFILNFVKNEKIVFLALLIFFLNGGFGFFYFFQDFFASQKSPLEFLSSMPQEYTDIKDKGYWWINNYLAYFLPQRGFLFAFPITLTVLSLLYVGFKKNRTYFFIIAGLLTGFLPFIQAHSLFFLFLISTLFFPLSLYFSDKNQRLTLLKSWILFAIITTLISIPIFRVISQNSNPLQFIKIDPGFTAKENIIWFWFKNLGVFLPVLIFALIYLYKNKFFLLILYIPFIAIFFLSNILIFQPWGFDNSKLLIYWYFASSIVVAYFLYEVFFAEELVKKITGAFIIFFMIFSGLLDIFRTFTPVTNYQIFSKEDVNIADSVKNLTNKNGIFVTAPIHNHPIPALSGRSTLVGYHGWLWTHGIDYLQRAQDVEKIYAGENFENLVSKYQINYITVGPHEIKDFAIDQKNLSNYPRIILNQNWSLYDVSNIWTNGNRQN